MVHPFLFFIDKVFAEPAGTNLLNGYKWTANFTEDVKIHDFLWQFQGPDPGGVYKNTPPDIYPEDMALKNPDIDAFYMVYAILSKIMEEKYDPMLIGGVYLDPYTTSIGEAVRQYARTRWISDDRIAENLVRQALRYVDLKIVERTIGIRVS